MQFNVSTTLEAKLILEIIFELFILWLKFILEIPETFFLLLIVVKNVFAVTDAI